MGQQGFLLGDFLKMGSKLKKGIFCTNCGFLNSVQKIIKKYDHCKRCKKEFQIQYHENLDEDMDVKKNHVKDFIVCSVIDDYVNEVQRIIIQRIDKTSITNKEEMTCENKQINRRRRNPSSCRKIDTKNDFCDVTLTCDDKQSSTHKTILYSDSDKVSIKDIDEKFKEIYNKLCEEICNEVSSDQCKEVAGEVIEGIVESSHKIYEIISQEVLYKIWNELQEEAY